MKETYYDIRKQTYILSSRSSIFRVVLQFVAVCCSVLPSAHQQDHQVREFCCIDQCVQHTAKHCNNSLEIDDRQVEAQHVVVDSCKKHAQLLQD